MMNRLILDLSAAELAHTALPEHWETDRAATAEISVEGRVPVALDMILRHFVAGAGADKPKVLLLHGFPETARAWTAAAARLAANHEVHLRLARLWPI